MKKIILLMMALLIVFPLSCSTTGKPRKEDISESNLKTDRQGQEKEAGKLNGENAPKAKEKEPIDEDEVLKNKFALLVKDTERELKRGTYQADQERIREFYGTPLEKDAMLLFAATHEYFGDLKSAGEIYSELIERYPESAEGFAGLIHILLEQNDSAGAGVIEMRLHTQVLEGNPSRLYNELASLSIQRRNTGDADRYLDMAKEHNLNQDTLLYNRAVVRLMEGKAQESLHLLEMTSPAFQKSHYYGLLISIVNGTIYDAGTEKDDLPGKIRNAILNHSVIMASDRGDSDEAEQLLSQALEMEIGGSETLILLGNARFENGLFREAAKYYQKSIELNPYIPEAHLNLGLVSEIYFQDFSRAKSCYRSYLELGGQEEEKVKKWLKNIEMGETRK